MRDKHGNRKRLLRTARSGHEANRGDQDGINTTTSRHQKTSSIDHCALSIAHCPLPIDHLLVPPLRQRLVWHARTVSVMRSVVEEHQPNPNGILEVDDIEA